MSSDPLPRGEAVPPAVSVDETASVPQPDGTGGSGTASPEAAPLDLDLRGRVLGGRYRLDEPIGQGGSAVVYRGYDQVLDRPVAVKVLAHVDDRLRRQLRAEARASGRLNHPRIAQIFDYGETDGNGAAPVPYIVMEFVDGEPLSRRLAAQRALPWPDATLIAGQIAEALSAAHARGLVHRDIKPDNVIITDTGVKLVDFGISAAIGSPDADDDGRLLGTPSYVAPERIADAPVGPAADVYSLGVLLYRMLTGAMPWTADTRTQQLKAHVSVEAAPLPLIDGLPSEIADLYLASVAKDPHNRPSSADSAAILAGGSTAAAPGLGKTLEPLDADRSILPPTQALPRAYEPVPAPQTARRRSRVFAVSVAVVAIAVLAVAWATGGLPTGTPARDRPACNTALTVLRDTGSTFTAAVRITNTGRASLSAWQLTFAFPGGQAIQPDSASGDQVTVTPSSGAQYTAIIAQSGPTVTARSGAGQGLPAGEAATLPIRARYLGINQLPTAFDLNGHACQTQIAGVSSPGSARPISPTSTPPTARPPTAHTAPTSPTDKGSGHGKGKQIDKGNGNAKGKGNGNGNSNAKGKGNGNANAKGNGKGKGKGNGKGNGNAKGNGK